MKKKITNSKKLKFYKNQFKKKKEFSLHYIIKSSDVDQRYLLSSVLYYVLKYL